MFQTSVEESEFANAVFLVLCLGLWTASVSFLFADISSGNEIFKFCHFQYGVAHPNISWQFGVEKLPIPSTNNYFWVKIDWQPYLVLL